jgi:hypothetical protein
MLQKMQIVDTTKNAVVILPEHLCRFVQKLMETDKKSVRYVGKPFIIILLLTT